MALQYRPVSLEQITALKRVNSSVAQYRQDARSIADRSAAALSVRFNEQWTVRGYTYAGQLQWFVAPEWALAVVDAGGSPQPGGGGGGGGAGGGGSAGGTGSALAAVQAGLPAYTGGGPSFSIGPANIQELLSQRDDEFRGMDSFTPPEKLSPGFAADCVNWDGFARVGSRCVRRGVAKLQEDRDSVTISASPIDASYRGLSIAAIPCGSGKGDEVLLAFADSEIGTVRTAQPITLHAVSSEPRWGRPATLLDVPGPLIALTQIAGPKVRVSSSYTNVFDATNQLGLRANSVVGLIIRYSGPTTTESYPLDMDGHDHMEGTTLASTALANRVSWKGESRTDDTAVLAVGKYWVTAWAFTREGYSQPSYASLTVT